MTSYGHRLMNIPGVLDTIFAQTLQPDLVVFNLAYEELLPNEVQDYIDEHHVEVNRVADTKVYKKLIPTLKKYPEDCVITIDDDFLYPQGMIEDFMLVHNTYPDFPISGNSIALWGLKCHCGCASLTKAEYFGNYLDCIDDEVIRNCPSDDMVYTYFANKSGHPYIRTKEQYYTNMIHYNEGTGYSVGVNAANGVLNTYKYLTDRFGKAEDNLFKYARNSYFAEIISDIAESYRQIGFKEGKEYIYSTSSYRIGNLVIKPLSWIRKGSLLRT